MLNRNDILKCLGDFPEKVDLDIREISSEDMGDYERKLLEYTVEKCNEKSKYKIMTLLKKYKLMC